jgi:hypothetical protein
MTTRLLLLPLLLGACMVTDEAPAPTVEDVARIIRCPILTCGENGPTAGDGFLLDEFDLWGRANHAGVKLASAYWDDGSSAYVDIQRDDLRAFHYGLGVWRRGTDLTKLTMRLEQPSTGSAYEVRVVAYDDQTVRFHAGLDEPMRLYNLQARRVGAPTKQWQSVCKPDMPLTTDPYWSSRPMWAVIYRGDRYSSQKQVIADNAADGWSFIACAATAGAKLHMHRHTNAGQYDRAGALIYPTSLSERTTLLKTITADFCGDGSVEFTEFGTPLAYATAREPGRIRDAYPWFRSIEGIWKENGPVCLDTPRREASGITRAYVEEKCGRKFATCDLPTSAPLWWTSYGYTLTANPP